LITAILLVSMLSNVIVVQASMSDSGRTNVPHYFGPYPNYATSQLPTVSTDENGSITSVTGGIRKFVDSLPGLGPAGANNLGQYLPVAVPDITTYPGSDYYEIAVVEYSQKMHSDLSQTKLRGYVQLSTSVVPGLHVSLSNPDGTQISYADGSQAYGVDTPRYLGPFIVAHKDRPVRVKFYNLLPTGTGGNLFLPVDTSVMGSGDGPNQIGVDADGNPIWEQYTRNRATVHLHGGNTPWISDGTTHQWITPAGESTSYPKGVSVYNVPDMPDPGPGAMTFYYTNHQSARLMFYHDHSFGITRLNVYAGEAAGYLLQDQTELDLIAAGIIPADQIPLVIQDKTFVPDNTVPITNMWGTFPSQLDFQDPTWDVTQWGGPDSLWYPHVYMTMQNPSDPSGMNPFGRWQYAPWFYPIYRPTYGPVPNPYYTEPGNPMEPPMIPGTPNPSIPGEAFLDTPVVNGVAYPYVELQPKAYRFRILNAADDRFWNLQLYVADPDIETFDGRTNTEVKMVSASENKDFPEDWPDDARVGGVPDPKSIGPSFIQIANEGGFLPAPYSIPMQPINWNRDQGTFDFGLVDKFTLLLAPAERADVIVDFSQFAGKILILYNDSPAPSPAADPRLDYFTGDPDQTEMGGAPSTVAGYGPNTRTIMQIRVANATAAAPFDVTALDQAFASTPTSEGVFAASQNPIIIPQAAYDSAYNETFENEYAGIFDDSLVFTPIGADTSVTIPFQLKSIQDAIGEVCETMYGRMSVIMGVEQSKTNPLQHPFILYNFADSPTEVFSASITGSQIGSLDDGTQIWKITHNGVDVHPLHWHMFEVQLINRIAWDNNIREPDPNELGWKDTIRINPMQITFVALRPIVPEAPFDVPNNIRPIDPTRPLNSTLKMPNDFGGYDPNTREPISIVNHLVNFGWEYVWHCHILTHEENDMMRPIAIAVPPGAPTGLTATQTAGQPQVLLSWTDSSTVETHFTIQRTSNAAGPWATIGNVTSTTGSERSVTVTYIDDEITFNETIYYRVLATNIVGDTWNYGTPGFPVVSFDSAPSEVRKVEADSIPPLVSITSPSTGSQTKSTTMTVTWTGSDAGSGIRRYEVMMDSGSWTEIGVADIYEFSGLSEGNHVVYVQATDNAEQSTQSSVDFTINTSLIGEPGWTDDAVIISGILVVVAVVVFLMFRRK
jgi:FtsP/CotA-like multicopper oxidase with cupredoxin domain